MIESRSPVLVSHSSTLSAVLRFAAMQVATFAGVRSVSREHVISAWMGGTLVRFVALVVYGFVVVKALGLPSGAALVSFAAFLFALTLIEPLLLNRS